MDHSPLGSSIHGILHTRILEWVAIPFSRGSSWPKDRNLVSSTEDKFSLVKKKKKKNSLKDQDKWIQVKTLAKSKHFFKGALKHFFVVVQLLSSVWLFVTLWTVACQALMSKEFSRQEHWNGLPLFSPGDLPGPGIASMSPALADRFLTTEAPGKLSLRVKKLKKKKMHSFQSPLFL